MSNYAAMASRQRKIMLIILGIILVITIVFSESKFLHGLSVGAVISFYNLWLLQRKTNQVGEAAAETGKRAGLGTISRLAAVALGTLICVRYHLDIVGFIIGLVISYPVMMIDLILFNKK